MEVKTIVVVQLFSHVQLFLTPWTAAHQASLSFTVSWSCSNSCLLMWWCHPTISSSVVPFSSCLQSLQESGSFPRSQFFTPGGQSVGVLPENIQDWFPLGWTGWISLQSRELSRVFSNTTVQKHQFFGTQPSLWFNTHLYMSTGKKHSFDYMDFVSKVMSLLFNVLSKLVTAFLPRSMHLLISRLQSQSAMILEPKKIKSVTVSIASASICHKVMGLDAMILVFECWILSQLFYSPL